MTLNNPAPENVVAWITDIFPQASTSPCKVTTHDGEEWVMKMVGTGPGPAGLLTEFVALAVAGAMGLRVPRATLLYLPPGFPWTIGTDEFDAALQRSYGWNLGIAFVDNARPAVAEEMLTAEPAFLRTLEQVDRFLGNMDRPRNNPNILMGSSGPIAIDFDACLFLRRAVAGAIPGEFGLPPAHFLYDAQLAGPYIPVGNELLLRRLDNAPRERLSWARLDRHKLITNINHYVAAWNSQCSGGASSN